MKKAFKWLVVLAATLALAFCFVACDGANGGTNNGSGGNGGGGTTVSMTESYKQARAEFKAVTGIELPALENIAVGEPFPYEEGATSYELDITEGVTEEIFQAFVAFLDTALSSWTKTGPTTEGVFTNIWYAGDLGRIGITWDGENTAVYVHAIMNASSSGNNQGNENGNQGNGSQGNTQGDENGSQGNENNQGGGNGQGGNGQGQSSSMTASYQAARNSFQSISGILLPELENVEASDESTFDAAKKEAQLVVSADGNVFANIVSAVKAALADEPLSDNNNHWEEDGFMAFWEWDYDEGGRMHKVTIQLENNARAGKITVGYWFRDYYTLTLVASQGGSVELKIAGRGQDGNRAHVCYNTYSNLYATASLGYEFAGFYEGNTQIGTENGLRYAIVKDVTITAKFNEIPSNMSADYKEARKALYEMSGISLPELEGVTTIAQNTTIKPDAENGVRDEFQCEFVFASAAEASRNYASFRAAVKNVEGDMEETSDNEYGAMDLWSPLYPDAPIPYRDDVMMNRQADGATIFLMWRKQPIVYYSVTATDGGTAYISYTGSDYQEHKVSKHWEIADAFHGKICAVANDGMEFVGWFVNGTSVSTEATYNFNYAKADVTFTSITFTAKFQAIQMTETYRAAKASFQEATGLTLPVFSKVGGYYMNAEKEIDIGGSTAENGATANTLSAVKEALKKQIKADPTVDGGTTTWEYSKEKNGVTYNCTVMVSFQNEGNGGLVVVSYSEAEAPSMTESYKTAREGFYTITGYTLPELVGIEMLESSDIRPEQHTTACFDIPATATDMQTIVDALQEQIKKDPKQSDETGTSWNIDVTIDGKVYVGQIWTMLDVPDESHSYVYVNYNVCEVSESYLTNRANFKEVTGILLPLIDSVDAGDFPYSPGTKEYCFDITGGDNLSNATFETLKDFFDNLEGWTGAPLNRSGEFDNYDYETEGGDRINLVWHRESEGDGATVGVYINAFMK